MHVCFRSGFWPAAALLLGLAVLCGMLFPAAAQAQETRPDSVQADTTRRDVLPRDTTQRDTLRRRPLRRRPLRTDTLRTDTTGADTTGADTTRADSARADLRAPTGAGGPPAGDAVQFSARDSLVIVFDQGERGSVGTLYGEAEVQQDDATLTAYEVQMLFDRNRLRAEGPPQGVRTDTLGIPRFQRGEDEAFTGSALSFDLETKRGRVVEARTGFQEGFVQGERVRVADNSTFFIRNGSYTTCDCPRDETPSYSLRSRKMKVQGKWVYTGPIQLFIYNIPTPLILPFAFLPSASGRHGGIIPPSYGRRDRLGFYLQDFGYYWPISDYMDLQLTGSLYSRGSWAVSPTFRYKRRYYYDGNLHVDYVRNIAGDVVDRNYLDKTTSKVVWNHNQQFIPSGAPNEAALRANVNLASKTYRRVSSDDLADNVTQRTNSSVNFRKRWNDGDQRASLDLAQTYFLQTGDADVTLPDLTFDQNSFYPFERERPGPGEEERWYERIQLSYDGALTNSFDFEPLSDDELRDRQGLPDSVSSDSLDRPGIAWYDALLSQEKYERATGNTNQRFDFGASHRIPLRAPFSLPRYQLNITPRLNYDEDWSFNTIRLDTVITGRDSTGAVTGFNTIERDEPGFFAQREFNLGIGANTTFYGLFPVRVGALRGLRHTVQPSLSFRYEPDYTTDFFGRTRAYTNPETGELVRYDITNGRPVRRSSARSSINFDIDNTFETKQVRVDSTGAEQEETLRLLTLDAGSGYNFAADERPLSDIQVRARFPVLRKKYNVDANMNFEFSPYTFDEEGGRLNDLVLRESGFLPAQLTSFSARISTDFQGGDEDALRNGSGQRSRGRRGGIDRSTGGASQVPGPLSGDVPGRPSLRQGIGQYANFDIPWSLAMDLSYAFTNEERFEQSRFIFNADFSFNITRQWKVTGVSGYDFNQGKLTATRLNLTRDFECWRMTFEWVPFGPSQRYGFNLRVKSSVLGDLLNLRLPRQGVDIGDRLGGVVSRLPQQ